jgi:hypothetical protein
MPQHGALHPFRDASVVVDSVIGIHNVMVECLFIINMRCIHKIFLSVPTDKKLENSNLAMQWVLLYPTISHDRCY